MTQGKRALCVLVGPTASGKSDAALAIAQAWGMEIVSADSMQVYRGMDIGTAKPTRQERAQVPHHMIDVADPSQRYTAALYAQQATEAFADIHARGKRPLLVGGTGLYIAAVVDGLDFANSQGDAQVRAKWEAYLAEQGASALLERLREVDPESAQKLHENDTRRVVRALEVFDTTGIPKSQGARRQCASPYDVRMAGLTMPRELLNARIDKRVDAMMAMGLLDEVRQLCAAQGETALQALGYKELMAHLSGACTLQEAVAAIKQGTRRYAKRQMTWFRRDARIHWVQVGVGERSDEAHIQELVDYFAQRQ